MKKTILTIVQIVVTLGILFWIFHDPQKRHDMLLALSNASPLWVLAGIAAYGIVEILGATRWQVLLRVQGIFIPWYRLGALLMIGIFFNQFMPGGTGGDVVKIFYLLKETPGKKTQALLAVLIDRVIGLLGLMLLVVPILFFKYHWLQQVPVTRNLTWTLILLLGACFFGVAVSFALNRLGLVHKLPQKMPLRDKLVDLSIAYDLYVRAWKASLLATLLSLGVHIFSFTMFYSAARSLQVKIPPLDFSAVMPIINTIASLPISVGGTGVREGLFQTLLNELCGVGTGTAVVISLLGFAMVLFWGLVGGVIYIFYRPSEHAKLSDIRSEVTALEHKVAGSE